MRLRLVLSLLAAGSALLVVAALTPALLAQTAAGSQRAAPADDAVVALVNELRALRAELADASRASIRSQLLVSRLQLQEQRIIYLDRQRADVSSRAAAAELERARVEESARSLERAMRDGSFPPEERRSAEAQITIIRAEIERHRTMERELRAEEAQLLNAVSSEQARWSDFSNRLDDLERALATR